MVRKFCNGPSHEKRISLPLTEEYWYFHKSGQYKGKAIGQCRACVNWKKLKLPGGPVGWIPVEKAQSLAKELIDRCDGVENAAKFSKIGESALRTISTARQERVQKKTVAKLVLALYEKRKDDRRDGASERFLKARRHQAMLEERLQRLSGY